MRFHCQHSSLYLALCNTAPPRLFAGCHDALFFTSKIIAGFRFCFAAAMDDIVINFRWIDFAIDDDDDFAYKYVVEVVDPEFGPLEVNKKRQTMNSC